MINVLPSFNVKDYKITDQGDYQVFVESLGELKACVKCGCIANIYKWGSKRQLFMDIPHGHSRVALIIDRQRYRCRDCNETFFEPLPDIDEKGL